MTRGDHYHYRKEPQCQQPCCLSIRSEPQSRAESTTAIEVETTLDNLRALQLRLNVLGRQFAPLNIELYFYIT